MHRVVYAVVCVVLLSAACGDDDTAEQLIREGAVVDATGVRFPDETGGTDEASGDTAHAPCRLVVLDGFAETQDPPGDFLAEADLSTRGFENFESDPPAGLDITDVTVTYEPGGDRTVVTVCFDGDARALEREAGRSVLIRPQFVDSDGDQGFTVEGEGETVYVSGGPDGVTVERVWLNSDELQFSFTGFAPDAGDRVRIEVLSRVSGESGTVAQGDEASVTIPE